MAIPEWEGRVSPVFDVAHQVVLVNIAGKQIVEQKTLILASESATTRAQELMNHGVGILICSAISDELRNQLEQHHIRVLAHRCGTVAEVLQAFLSGELAERRFAMPGCRCGLSTVQKGRKGNGKEREHGGGKLCCRKNYSNRSCHE